MKTNKIEPPCKRQAVRRFIPLSVDLPNEVKYKPIIQMRCCLKQSGEIKMPWPEVL